MSLPFDPVGAVVGIATGIYENFIKPYIDAKNLDAEKTDLIKSASNNYVKHMYTKLYNIRTIVFQDREVPLYKIYHPLKIVSDSGQSALEINSNCHFILEEFDRIMIIDYAGMGKSTISKYIFLSLCDKKLKFPIFVELRRIKENKGIIDIIREDFGSIAEPISPVILDHILSLDDVIIILDGFDEISIRLKDASIREITDIISRFPNIKYILTSRKDMLVQLAPTFSNFEIAKLGRKDIDSLLNLYDPENNLASKISTELDKITDESFFELLNNPMMVTLLYRSFGYNNEIPSKRHIFYSHVYKALFNGHDILKGYQREHNCQLDIDQFHNVLSYLAINSIKNGPSYDRNDLVRLIENASQFYGYTFSPSKFIEDALQAVPLFQDEVSEIRWVHKSFQDYFAAYHVAFINDRQRDSILASIYSSNKSFQYSNMIELCYDMKPNIIEENIIMPFIKEYLAFSDSTSIYPINKDFKDNVFLRSYICTKVDDIISEKFDSKGFFIDSKAKSLPILSSLIPDGKARMILQSLGMKYEAIAESPNRWILEMIVQKYPICIRTSDNIYAEYPPPEPEECNFGQNTMQLASESQIKQYLSNLLDIDQGESYILINDDGMRRLLEQITSRIRLFEISNDF